MTIGVAENHVTWHTESDAQQSVHLTLGILRHFRAFSTPKQNPALEVFIYAHPSAGNANRWAVPCKT